jgi:4-diphosphocytidyl-2C-methyl-D-erythritol kinase
MRSFSQALSGRLDLADLIENDLEKPALRLCPEIGRLKRRLQGIGAEAAAMSGSGPSVYGLFPDRQNAARAAEHFLAGGFHCRVSTPVNRDRFRESRRGVRRSCL